MLCTGMRKSGFGLICLALIGLWTAQADCLPEADSTAEMTHCKIKVGDYPRPVHLYFSQPHSEKYFVHFHGHNLEGFSHFDKRWGDYGQYLLNSKADAVLVVPESEGKCSTYDTYFADPIRTKNFFDELEKETNTSVLVGMSGHSGAYRVLNRLSAYANKNLLSFKAIGLFDATYSDTPEIKTYVREKKIFLMDAFVTGPQATTEDLSRELMKELHDQKTFYVPVIGEKGESLLEQHFMVLKRGSLEVFFSKASAL